MSILSTNQKLVRVGQEYSAGSGISIDDYVISYTGDEGREYSAGENIGISDYVISSRNWTPDITYAAESAFQRATGYTDTQISALSGEVSSEVSQLGSDIQYISGVALTAHQSLEGYLTKASGDEYYQPIGSYATVSQLESTSGEIVNLIPTDYVNTETLEQTSGNIVNLIPDTSEFITNVSAEQTYLTKNEASSTYQPIGNYLSSNALEGYATQDWVGEQGYLTSVSIPESATWQDVSTTVQTNSAQWAEGGGTGGDPEVNEFVYNNSATINEVNTSYQTNSGNFLTAAPANMATTGDVAELAQTISETYQVKGDYLTTADSANFYPANNPSSFATEDWVTAQGYITGVDLSEYAKRDFVLSSIESATSGKLDVSSFASVSSDFLTTSFGISESAHWEEATNAYEQNSATYLTSHQDLSDYAKSSALNDYQTIEGMVDYQTVAGMTAYQPIGDYATTGDLALKQDTLTFGYDEQDRINSINSSALAGGGDVPEDVMVETNLEYNAVGEISGYGNSAIAQYGAEKQWLVHDDTLVHVVNSAQYALGVAIDNVARLMGVDETVLFDGSITGYTSAQLSENVNNFNRVKVFYSRDNAWTIPLINSIEMCTDILSGQLHGNFTMGGIAIDFTNNMDGWYYATVANITDDIVSAVSGRNYKMAGSATFDGNFCLIKRVIGIGRKQ